VKLTAFHSHIGGTRETDRTDRLGKRTPGTGGTREMNRTDVSGSNPRTWEALLLLMIMMMVTIIKQ
jgi:hypothetical protein